MTASILLAAIRRLALSMRARRSAAVIGVARFLIDERRAIEGGSVSAVAAPRRCARSRVTGMLAAAAAAVRKVRRENMRPPVSEGTEATEGTVITQRNGDTEARVDGRRYATPSGASGRPGGTETLGMCVAPAVPPAPRLPATTATPQPRRAR